MLRKLKLGIAAVMMLLLSCQVVLGAESTVSEQSFAASLMSLKKTGATAVSGSEAPLTREKAAVMITKYLGYDSIAKDLQYSCRFTDVTGAKGEIELINRLEIMNGTGETVFSPQLVMTKEQTAAIISKVAAKLQQPVGWKHICYAISSSSQMAQMAGFDAVSFGWSYLKQADGHFTVAIDDKTNDFKVPAGFTGPLNMAKSSGAETYLMVYFEEQQGRAASFLNNPVERINVINQLLQMTQGLTYNGEIGSFDGVTIDFEGFKSPELSTSYVNFLKELRSALTLSGKKLNVAVQPNLYYKGYDYRGISENCDHIILMAHDYAAKTLTPAEMSAGQVMTPVTPINAVYKALYDAKSQVADSSKVALQFSFASVQWQSQNGVILNSKAYTPGYDKIGARLQQPGTKRLYNAYYQSNYATYTENNVTNTIWYEDTASLQAKMDLAKMLDISGISYWRLGLLPQWVNLVK